MAVMDTSYLEKQVSTIINKLHELFDEIGVPSHERDSRESELFAALSETLHERLRVVTNEKHKLAEECEKLITTIKQMHISLEGKDAALALDDELLVTYPLQPCLHGLKDKAKTVGKLHRERYDQVKKLALAIDSYSSHLEPAFMKIELPPLTPNASIPPTFDLSHTYFTALDIEFTRVYEEYQRRLAAVQQYSSEIINLWAELGTPQAQTESRIVELWRESPEQLGLHAQDLASLKAKRDKLMDEKKGREKRLKDVGTQIEQLWERLCISEDEQREFLARNRGCGMRVLNEYEDELGRLNELKKQNLGLFVEEARVRLQGLWDELYFSEDEMLAFAPAFSDVYSDALLSSHEAEISRLESLKEQRMPILSLIDRHKNLIKERDDLTASSQDASRLMLKGQKGEKRDPGKLLREEKMRKRIAKELPKVEAELRKGLERWEDEYGRPFLVVGERYIDDLDAAQAVAERQGAAGGGRKERTAAAELQRSKTPGAQGHTRSNSRAGNHPSNAGKAGTVKAATAPKSDLRSKTPTSFATMRAGTGTHQPTTAQKLGHAPPPSKLPTSPSRIPGRPPLSNTHGNKSPDRKYHTVAAKSMGPPPRLPPPKMKDLFVPPQQHPHDSVTGTPTPMFARSTADLERSASMVRGAAVEDPYTSRPNSVLARSAYGGPPPTNSHSHYSLASNGSSVENHNPGGYDAGYSNHHNQMMRASHYSDESHASSHAVPRQYVHAPPPASRQISGTSATSMASASTVNSNGTANSGGSASENWETFDEDGGSGDAEEHAYYAKMQMMGHSGHGPRLAGKRLSPDGGWAGEAAGKRARAIAGHHAEGGREGSWTDEDGY